MPSTQSCSQSSTTRWGPRFIAFPQDILQQGKQQGTWQLLTVGEEDDGQLQLAGQVTMRFAWRSALD